MTATRIRALDGLRALAVLAVVLEHFGPVHLAELVHPGRLGVRLFFVLSGFLITGILLEARAAGGPAATGSILRAFFVRRALRLLPLFYVVLAISCVFSPSVREGWLWHATYQTNHYIAILGGWPTAFAHAWSLAVEEQFYLVWPWIILLLPLRALGPAMAGAG